MHRNSRFQYGFRAAISTSILALASAAAPAMAQSAPQSAETGTSDSGIGDIVVTARRTNESLQKTPVAITVVSSEVMQRRAVVDLHDLQKTAPSLNAGQRGAGARETLAFFVRGSGQTHGGIEPSVVTYLNEVPLASGIGAGALFDLESAQILKGPQGTLFGRNSVGGAVLLTPTKPGSEFGGFVDARTGNYGLARIEAAVNIPISDTLHTRFAMEINHRKGYTTIIQTGQDIDNRNFQAFRFSANWKPSDRFEDNLMVGYVNNDTNNGSTFVTDIRPGSTTTAVFGQTILDLAAAQAARGPHLINAPSVNIVPFFDQSKQWMIVNSAKLEISDNVSLKNIFGYVSYKVRSGRDSFGGVVFSQGLPPPNLSGGQNGSNPIRAITDEQQLILKSSDGRLNAIVGGYFERRRPYDSGFLQQVDIVKNFAATNPTYLVQLSFDDSRALFAQATYEILPSVRITGGLRYTWDTRRGKGQTFLGTTTASFCSSGTMMASGTQIICSGGTPAVLANCSLASAEPGTCEVNLLQENRALTWTAGIDWQVSPTTLLYVASRKGYKSGAFNASATLPVDRNFGPEYMTDVELGLKSDFNLGTMPTRLNLAVYKGWFRGRQVSGVDFVNGRLQTITRSAGVGHIQGLEAELTIKPTHGFEINAFYAYTDPKFTQFLLGGVDYSNSYPFVSTPKNKFGISGRYEQDVGVGTFAISSSYTYQSKVYFQEPVVLTLTNPNRGQDGYGLLDARIELNNIAGTKFSAFLFATNLTNKYYKSFESESYDTSGSTSVVPGEPRMIGGGVRYTF